MTAPQPTAARPRPRPRPHPVDVAPDPPPDPPTDSPTGPPVGAQESDGSHRSPLEAIEAALAAIPHRQSVALPRWLGWLAVSASVSMLPWMVYLGFTLPARVSSNNYDIAWLGFDSALILVLAAVAYCAIRHRPATGLFAAVACAMLVIDAWFDITTSGSADAMLVAIFLAVVGELPLAIVCAWAAVNAERVRADAHSGMRQRWQTAVESARSAAAAAAQAGRDHPATEAALRRLSPPPAAPPSR